ncbi:hypothetical protein [Marinobacter sp.]|uniref:hypothetical protein n=1 Tax=Marinobacter sp. TaxID=50741 RepID=UPI002B26AA55|nr:hypothetical protein [Marinobacter sp.]
MKSYLEKIRKGQPVNYPAFLKKLPEHAQRLHRDIFTTQKVSVNRWLVTVNDAAAFENLSEMATVPASRVEAAKQGDSHRHATGVSFVLAYHQKQPGPRPDAVVIVGDDVDIGFERATNVLVIENEQNFYSYQQMLSFVCDVMGASLELEGCDVVLGGGNRITQAATLKWLAGYQKVFCAFDYDIGGLQMFATMARLLDAVVESFPNAPQNHGTVYKSGLAGGRSRVCWFGSGVP